MSILYRNGSVMDSLPRLLTIVLAAGFFALDNISGYKRVFSLEDTS
jgi:hypothetical protein